MEGLRRIAPVLAWVAALMAVASAMQALGTGALAAPDLSAPATWGDWVARRTAPEAAMAVLRLVVLVLTLYLLVVTVLAVLLRLGSAGRLVTAADVVTLPFVRSLVQAGLGVGLAGAALAAVGSVTVDPTPAGSLTAAEAELVASSRSDDAAVMQMLPPEGAPPVMQKLTAESPQSTWTVAAGDHLWSIAERVLEEAWQRPAQDAEVVSYWQQVIEQNRDRLADPSNPDLLFPGQVLVVPAPPPEA